jgi:GT2 family glycosyltransferase
VRRIAAVIPTFNAESFIAAHLRSVLIDQTLPPEIVYVVDNGSVDRTLELIETGFPNVKVHRLGRNRGFGSACNLGLQSALDCGAEFVLVLNQDTVLAPHACEEALIAAQADCRLGLVAFFQLRYDGEGIDPVFRNFLPDVWFDDFYHRHERMFYELDFVPAAAVVIRREALEEVGGFDPLFFMYKEDRDLCRRLRLAGWKVGVAPRAIVYHHCGQVHAKRGWRWNFNWAYSEAVFHLKWSPRRWPLPVLTLAKRIFNPPRLRETAARFVAFVRCLVRLSTIARHRSGNPADLCIREAGRGTSRMIPDGSFRSGTEETSAGQERRCE